MAFEDYDTKKSVVIVYTGEGKGKTTAALGLMARSLGNRQRVAFIQFIKYWGVSEHVFIRDIKAIYKDKLLFYKGGKGFYKAGSLSPKHVSNNDHIKAAKDTFKEALKAASSGNYDLVICDEINNAVHDGLITKNMIKKLIVSRSPNTSLCLTGRNFPSEFSPFADIITSMDKVKHHFDDKFLANKGIDF
ncbi:MAG: cob(I)yrinic acid a,c-diamide adenosyltransferase [Candidatus Saccharimonadales bacterium]